MGFFDAVALLFYFYAVREMGVAIGTVFLFSQPVWIAILAPGLLGSQHGAGRCTSPSPSPWWVWRSSWRRR